jgi:hypothetical protein
MMLMRMIKLLMLGSWKGWKRTKVRKVRTKTRRETEMIIKIMMMVEYPLAKEMMTAMMNPLTKEMMTAMMTIASAVADPCISVDASI